jgi:hypothetical protein
MFAFEKFVDKLIADGAEFMTMEDAAKVAREKLFT